MVRIKVMSFDLLPTSFDLFAVFPRHSAFVLQFSVAR